ncbi:MAG: hypothetical protein KF718_17250 [Polyangiaceae bacterium]|nr:hypothetical protein [Polyangiaceae bacterium]
MRRASLTFMSLAAFALACGGSDDGELFGGSGTGGAAAADGGATGGAGGQTGGTGAAPSGGSGGTGAVPSGGGTGAAPAGGTGAGPAGGSGGVGASPSGGTGGGGAEDCTNGVDDNADGLIDCADPQCQAGYVCTPAPPTGWQVIGFVDEKPQDACPSGYQAGSALYDPAKLDAKPANCECGCDTPNTTTASCRAQIRCNGGTSCTTTQTLSIAGCSQISFQTQGATYSCRVSGSGVAPGTCATQVKTDVPPAAWDASARSCQPTAAGKCAAAAEACVAKLAGAVGPCIAQPGDHECPAGSAYSQKRSYADGTLNDTRACSATGCSCGASAGAECGCTSTPCGVRVNAANNCGSGPLATVPASGTCTTFTDANNGDNNWGMARIGYALTNPGSCPPSGSPTATGSATPAGPVTVCCLP